MLESVKRICDGGSSLSPEAMAALSAYEESAKDDAEGLTNE